MIIKVMKIMMKIISYQASPGPNMISNDNFERF